MRLYFVRHGESEANILRQISNRGWVHGLTEKGCRQAGDLSVQLRERAGAAGLSRIYTSPLRRAVETAQILSASLGIPYETTDALREFDCGIAEGGADERNWGYWHWVWEEWHIHKRYESKIEGGESYLDLIARMRPFLEDLCAPGREDQGDPVLIGHGGLFIAVLPDLLANPDLRVQIGDIGIPNTGIILVEVAPQGLVCREWCGKAVT
jgi:broad specificity phosphatase PhoE